MPSEAAEYLADAALREPDLVREELLRLDAEESLLDFVRLMWRSVEPRRRLIEGWCLECLCEHLEAVHFGQIGQLLVNIPPGMMKSLLINVFFPSWEWGPRNRPDLRYVSFSYSSDLTVRDNVKARKVMASPLYQRLWGDRFAFSREQNAKNLFANDHSGLRYATSVLGVGTGERGDRIVIDDAHKVSEVESPIMRMRTRRWFSNEIVTRINDDGSVVLAVGQRTHLDDVYGLMLKEDLGFEWLCLPMEFEGKNRAFTQVPRKGVPPIDVALIQVPGESIPRWVTRAEAKAGIESGEIPAATPMTFVKRTLQDRRTKEGEMLWPERFSKSFVENRLKRGLRAEGGNYAVAAQLQQRPIPREGGLFHREDFRFIDRAPNRNVSWVRGWDLAGTKKKNSPYTASAKMALDGTDVIIADVDRDQMESRMVYERIAAMVIQDGPNVVQDFPQDPGQAGKDQKRHIRKLIRDLAARHPELGEVVVRFSPETGSKETRAAALAADGEAGTLYLVRGPWNDAFIAECVLFPAGFSDQVDAASRARSRLVRTEPVSQFAAPEIIEDEG